jgi:hypothetical protein
MAIIQREVRDEMADLRTRLEDLQYRARQASSVSDKLAIFSEVAEILKELEGSEWIS